MSNLWLAMKISKNVAITDAHGDRLLALPKGVAGVMYVYSDYDEAVKQAGDAGVYEVSEGEPAHPEMQGVLSGN